MRNVIAAAVVGMLGLSACTPDLMLANSKPAHLSASDVSKIKSAMTYAMFDPASAQFRNIRGYDAVFQDGHSERRACFEVNGKNRMGGYVGFEERGAKKVGNNWEIVGYCHQIGYKS